MEKTDYKTVLQYDPYLKKKRKEKENYIARDFPGGSVAKTLLSVQGVQVWSLGQGSLEWIDPTGHN